MSDTESSMKPSVAISDLLFQQQILVKGDLKLKKTANLSSLLMLIKKSPLAMTSQKRPKLSAKFRKKHCDLMVFPLVLKILLFIFRRRDSPTKNLA